MKYAIETKNLTKKFGKMKAVDGLNLQVPEGSIFAFLGPNGAGKTTTIKMLTNIITSTSGTIKVLGVDSVKLGPKEFEHIGYVSENQKIPEWMSVGKFLKYCKTMYGNWDDKFCSTLVKQFDLDMKQKIKSLSRGMKMKVSLISSLAYRPKLLIFDEPFTGLDPLVRDEFISGMLDITENEKWTIFISSHDIDEVERLADWVGIVDKGALKFVEKTDDLQKWFRKVELISDTTLDKNFIAPEGLYLLQQQDGMIRFYDSCYKQGESETKWQTLFSHCSNIEVFEMSLKEIFIAHAKQSKILDVVGGGK